jgi:hypothetical protein
MNEPARPTSTLAITSFVSGILGWTLLPLLGSIVAVVTGHMARAEIRRDGGRLGGDGFAVAGLVLGWLSIAAVIVGLAVLLVFFGGVAWLAAVQ